MKRKPEDYIDCGFYSGEDDIEKHSEKVVKCRKPHQCSACIDEWLDELAELESDGGQP